jgi:hypothetical protein
MKDIAIFITNLEGSWALVAHTCDPRYLERLRSEESQFKASLVREEKQNPISKMITEKK